MCRWTSLRPDFDLRHTGRGFGGKEIELPVWESRVETEGEPAPPAERKRKGEGDTAGYSPEGPRTPSLMDLYVLAGEGGAHGQARGDVPGRSS